MPVFFVHGQKTSARDNLLKEISQKLGSIKGDFAVAFKMIGNEQSSILINADSIYHAASTMKVPVMMEAFRQAKAGRIKFNSEITLHNKFKSIVDSSEYSLSPGDDSDSSLYLEIGRSVTFYELVYRMITRSSNLATNTVIDIVGAQNVTRYVRQIGALQLTVMRGVEDQKAFDKGLNNVTSAKDLLMMFEAIATRHAVSRTACDSMINILSDQEFKTIIPAQLPAGLKIAHKTGSITGVQHDAGIVYLPSGHRYVLVLLSKNIQENEGAAVEAMAGVSRLVFDYASTLK